MKNLHHFFTALLFLSIVSCADNESVNTTINQEELIGLWNISNYYAYSQEATAYVNGQSISGDFSSYSTNMNVTTLFEETPNLVTTQGSFTSNNTVNFLGQYYNYNFDVNEIPEFISTANWQLQDDIISFTNQEQTILADIIYFRNDTLRLKTIFNKELNDSINIGINQQIDSLNYTAIPIDSLKVKADLYLTLTR